MPLRRLDAEARAVIDLANDIAYEYGLEYVGTEHILLAIVRHADNMGARVLGKFGVHEDKIRAKVDEFVQRAKEDTWVFGRLPGSPHYRDVIERAMGIADQLEARTIGSAHLLLALFHDDNSTAQQALLGLGVTQKKCRDEVLHLLSAK
jgi:ATP-dependent Clp protease ATP-binding subunit ClpC